jgi:aromatic-amino-acid transaminase
MRLREYRYFDDRTRGVDFAAMRDDLKAAGPRDTVILHGCCHNPTGANLSREEWAELTAMALAQGFLPLVDFAYQGFGDGLAADAEGVRAMAAEVPEMLLAASCSKNFGVYRDRVGSAIVVSRSTKERDVARENLSALNRLNYSFAPDHGAAVVTTILTDPILRADWEAELESMRVRMLALRKGLAEAMRRETNDSRFDFVAGHRGMFSRLGATPEQVARLKAEDAIYLVGDGRINVAGLPEGGLDALARALVRVGM